MIYIPGMNNFMTIEGRSLGLQIKRNPRSRRLSLRLDGVRDTLVVVAPPTAPVSVIETFVRSKAGWISRQLLHSPQRIAFEVGARVPVEGVCYEIILLPQSGRSVLLENDQLLVSGDPLLLPSRVGRFLKVRANDRIMERSLHHANALDTRFSGVSLRDTKSRWGSCSSTGRLSFSWRLIMAPPEVLDYVTAHEVAHLLEFNHSAKFWSLVEALVGDVKSPRRWLRTKGAHLHAYG